jgi:hypothetical protein
MENQAAFEGNIDYEEVGDCLDPFQQLVDKLGHTGQIQLNSRDRLEKSDK